MIFFMGSYFLGYLGSTVFGVENDAKKHPKCGDFRSIREAGPSRTFAFQSE
jgi:hypothetical protein